MIAGRRAASKPVRVGGRSVSGIRGGPAASEAQEKQERVMEALTKWLINNAPELLEQFLSRLGDEF